MARSDPWASTRPWTSHPTAHLEKEFRPWLLTTTVSKPLPRGRKFRRIAVKTDIWIGIDGIFTRTWGELRDLSEGGAFVETDQRFAIGSLLNLRFQLPGTGVFVAGTVIVRRHQDQSGIGVEFLDLPPEDRARVREHVAFSSV